jgi:hypothetical protein
MAARKSRPSSKVTVEELAHSAREAVEHQGAVKVSALGPKGLQTEVIERLLALGFESTGKVVRKPLRAQILGALSHGASVPLKAVKDHVTGAATKELSAVSAALIDEGAALLVLRGKEPTLVASSARVVSGDSLRRFEKELKVLGAVVTGALKRPRGGLLLGDVTDALERLRVLAAPTKRSNSMVERVLQAVDDARDEQMGLSFVPSVIRSLHPELDTAQARAALLEAAKRGLLELRPEGGLARLSADELELCPPGPQGTRLSWAKRNEGALP